MALKFHYNNEEHSLVFKRIYFSTEPIASSEELRNHRRNMRDMCRELIKNLPADKRGAKVYVPMQRSIYKGPLADWVATCAFVTNSDGVASEVYTSVCDPFDRFERETGRINAIRSLKHFEGELGQLAAQCYGQR